MATKFRNVIGILKDKASLIKATLSITNRHTSSTRVAVQRATTHDTSSPPSERCVSAVLGSEGSRRASCACIEALMDRLNATRSAAVALKCLVVAHNIVSRGSFILRDQLSIYPSSGGHNFLNLSTFQDKSDNATWKLSAWVRWYAAVVEQNLVVSRVLGYYFSSEFSNSGNFKIRRDREEKLLALLTSEMLSEVEALVGFVEITRDAPDSWTELQKNDLVYKVARLVGEDYKLVQYELTLRMKEIGERTKGTSYDELTRLQSELKRLEDCKERLLSLFLVKRRDSDFWDLIDQVKMKVEETIIERENQKLVRFGDRQFYHEKNESSRFRNNNPFMESEDELYRLRSSTGGWSSNLALMPALSV